MARRNRLAFTLVEMLVVIVIISMLVAMLMPAIGRSRERARQTQCINNQHEVSLAILQYENSLQRFPGYSNHFGSAPYSSSDTRRALGWPMVILQQIGRQDVWEQCRGLTTSSDLSGVTIRMAQYVCPSAGRTDTAALSYVANCGLPDLDWTTLPLKDLTYPNGQKFTVHTPDGPTTAVFHDRYHYRNTTDSGVDAPKISLSGIKDGASHTLMISENLQTNTWLSFEEYEVGMLFHWVDYGYKPKVGAQPANDYWRINGSRNDPNPTVDNDHARPASSHPGGVVVSYCDGRSQFLNEGIQYFTFQHLMTPDSMRAARINDTAHNPTDRPLLPDGADSQYVSE